MEFMLDNPGSLLRPNRKSRLPREARNHYPQMELVVGDEVAINWIIIRSGNFHRDCNRNNQNFLRVFPAQAISMSSILFFVIIDRSQVRSVMASWSRSGSEAFPRLKNGIRLMSSRDRQMLSIHPSLKFTRNQELAGSQSFQETYRRLDGAVLCEKEGCTWVLCHLGYCFTTEEVELEVQELELEQKLGSSLSRGMLGNNILSSATSDEQLGGELVLLGKQLSYSCLT
ncbi:hypothetical protein Tco_1327195 [Tanacetum coccineum]